MKTGQEQGRAVVVVLGDIARSPRMRYHAAALAEDGYAVEIVGYATPAETLAGETLDGDGRRILLRRLSTPPLAGRPGGRGRLLFQLLWRSLVQPFELLLALLKGARPELILVQVPPSLPTLLIAALVGKLRGSRTVADWHNFGSSLVALDAGAIRTIVRLAAWYERVAARSLDAHLCVSRAMHEILTRHWNLAPVAVLHDRAAPEFLAAIRDDSRPWSSRLRQVAGPEGARPQRLVVTSTSWTPDEDMDLALRALVSLDVRLPAQAAAALEVVITGDGSGRRRWEERASAAGLTRIVVRTGWLELREYAALLATADLGICLHRSSSGVDLPMKVVDMHGAGLPVAAFDYGPCLREALLAAEEPLTFRTAGELCDVLAASIQDVTGHIALRERVRAGCNESWADGWRLHALPLLRGPLPR